MQSADGLGIAISAAMTRSDATNLHNQVNHISLPPIVDRPDTEHGDLIAQGTNPTLLTIDHEDAVEVCSIEVCTVEDCIIEDSVVADYFVDVPSTETSSYNEEANLEVLCVISPWLMSSPLLQMFDTSQLRLLCEAGRVFQLNAGQPIYSPGRRPSSLYFIVQGLVEVRGLVADTRFPGDIVGESVIIPAACTFESAYARSATTLIELPLETLRAVIGFDEDLVVSMTSTAREHLALIGLHQSRLFEHADEFVLSSLAKLCVIQSHQRGQLIDAPVIGGENLRIVLSGQLAWTENYGHHEILVGTLQDGLVFQVPGKSRTAMIRATTEVWLLALEKQTVFELVAQRSDIPLTFDAPTQFSRSDGPSRAPAPAPAPACGHLEDCHH